jgi:class 3 adenylate cyclase/predicted ATPase
MAMDVGEWLRHLGLGQYGQRFRDNKIDADVLVHLTTDDLKELGVFAVGDRRKLLTAIAQLSPSSHSEGAPATATRSTTRAEAERRPVAVMFCDLVGSTSLALHLDAEDWRGLVGRYLDDASNAVTAFGGHVVKKLGDGLMALFGYPLAQENDAERAVRAALAIHRAVADINAANSARAAPDLSVRIGVDYGPVVLDATGEVFGDAPSVAVRVQTIAEPGTVLISLGVQRQVAGLFVVEERPPLQLKGVSEPVQLFSVIRASGAGRRRVARVLTPFVGREEELGLLARRWERARAGDSQLVLIIGEPGLGKSRLIEEFHARLAETPHTWSEWSASQLLQNTPLHPIAEWGRLRFGGSDVPAEQRFAQLESALRQVNIDADEAAPLLAPLLEISPPPARAASLAPEELRRRQLALLVSWIIAGARFQPVVLAFEDLQWADPTSIDLLRALAEGGQQAALLLVATARPEFRPPWSMHSHHSVVSLAPLERAQIVRMVCELASKHAFSKEVIEGVSERTGGVPLFIEEVTRLLLERGIEAGSQGIPPTLQQSLAARLDRLGPAREVAQIGAVLGRNFAYELLRRVAELDEPALQASLKHLAEADLLFLEGAPPEANYRFKHALIQDAAYDSLLRSRRQALHRRAAEILRDDPERAAAAPEVVAHHFTEAGLDDLAIEWWWKAGDQALRRSAFQEATAHLGKAVEMADKDEGAARVAGPTAASSQRMKLQMAYGQALMYSKGYIAEETRAAFARAGELAGQAETSILRRQTRHVQWARSLMGGEINSARSLAESWLHEAEAQGRAVVHAHRAVGLTCLYQGELALARGHLELALADDASEQDVDARQLFGIDFKTTATGYLALSVLALGDAEHARRLIEQAVREGQETGHVATIANTAVHKVLLESFRDNPAATLRASEQVVEFARQHNMAAYAAAGELFLLWARGRLFDPEAGGSQLRQALAAFVQQGNKLFAPTIHGLIAELEAMLGRADVALASVDAGLALAEETGERWTDPLLFRRKGEILFQRDSTNPTPAQEAFRTAIQVAKQQGSRSFGLRAALSLAKLYHSTGWSSDVPDVLAPALEGFSPTPELPEIADAQALIERLA